MSNTSALTAQSRKGPKFLSVLMAAVLVGSIAVDGYCAYDLMGRKIQSTVTSSEKKEEDKDETKEKAKSPERTAFEEKQVAKKKSGDAPLLYSLLDGLENKTVNDNSESLALIKALHAELGLKDVDNELEYVDTVDKGEWVRRHYKQVYNGLEVVGGGLTVTTDKDTGKVVDIDSNHFNIPEDFKTEPTVTFDNAKDKAQDFVSKTFKDNADKVRLDNEGTKIIPVSKDNVKLGYNVSVTDKETNKKVMDVVVDGETGDVTAVRPGNTKTVKTDTSGSNIDRGDKTLTGEYDGTNIYKVSDEQYELTDGDRNIRIKDVSQDGVITLETGNDAPPASFDPTKPIPDTTPIDIFRNTEIIYDFYDKMFGLKGIDVNNNDITISYGGHTLRHHGVNGTEETNIQDSTVYAGDRTIIVGKDSDPNTPSNQATADELGQAYTKGIIDNVSELYDGYAPAGSDPEMSEPYAIAEGISEVLGEIIEDYANDGQLNNNCDWVNNNGNMKVEADANNYKKYETPCVEGKNIIASFGAQLAASGIDTLTEANLFIDLLPTLGPRQTFDSFRRSFEALAVEYTHGTEEGRKLTADQFEAIIDAFDKVGIAVNYDYKLASEGTIKVIGDDEESYETFKVKLTNYNEPSEVIFEGEASSETFKLPASVHNGLYILTLSDKKDENVTVSYTILINNNSADQKAGEYPDSITAYTRFGAEGREVVLVLDISGSMDGNPIIQTREAATKFSATVLDQSPATKISLVTYSREAQNVVTSSNNKTQLADAVSNLYAYGGTNTYEGMSFAKDILEKSSSQKKLIVLMSDGEPNNGPTENGEYSIPIVKLADELKQKGVTIYTLGFFHNLSGSGLSACQKLMSDIASEGYDYIVDNADDVNFSVDDPESDLNKVFNDFAEMINGKKYINIRIACPVDVTVSYNGETLSSNKKHPLTRTSFGSLSYEKIVDEETGNESEDTVKVLRLEEGADYEVCINGTGKGKMDYTISYPDEDGEYTDVRSFKGVPITKDTVIATSTKQEEKVGLSVDTDGDGKFDLNYEAEKNNKKAEKTSKDTMLFVILILANSLLAVIVIIYAALAIRRKMNASKAAKPVMPSVCTNCGAALDNTSKFCRSCGTPIAAVAPAPVMQPEEVKVKRSKAPIIIKLAVITVCIGFTSVVLALYNSPATTVFKQLRDNQTESAQMIFNNSMEDTGLSAKYLNFLTSHHIGRAESAYNDNELSLEEYRTLLEGVKNLKLEDVSDEAKDKLKELDKASDSKKDGSGKTDAAASSEPASEADKD